MKIIPYGRQSISQADIAAVVKVLKSDFLTQGPAIAQFEEKFKHYVGAKYCVAVNSGTAALHTAYFACGLKKGDELITSPITFAATSNAALYLGAQVKFVDIDPETGNIDPKLINKAVSNKTKIITPIHYSGQPCNLKELQTLRKKYSIKIVEDACHALGAEDNGKKIGSCQYSDASVFSFHPVKHITTGEGGAITTNDPEIYRRAMLFRTHGITKDENMLQNPSPGGWYYEMQALGFNYRITDFQAALGTSQLKRIDTFLKKRRAIAQRYRQAFEKNPYFSVPVEQKNTLHAYHLYPIKFTDKYYQFRAEIFEKLRAKGILVQVHYVPVNQHPYYQSLGFHQSDTPLAEKLSASLLSLPMFPAMQKSEVERVIKVVLECCNEIAG